MTRVCLEVEMLKIDYFISNPGIPTSSLPSHSPVLGFKVVQGAVHQSHTQNLAAILSITQFLRGDSCSVRGHRQTVTVMVPARKGKEMPKHSSVDSASSKYEWEGAASSRDQQPGRLLKHPSTFISY